MPEFAIETNALRKTYGTVTAVSGLTLQVQRGEVFGFLGPNGAGKTTSIKMLLGLVQPTSGGALLLGRPPSDTSGRSQVGFLPEHFRFHEWLTGEEFLRVHGKLYGIGASLEHRVDELLERVGLTGFRKQQLRTYSKGMLQRIGLAQALLNRPQIVFLDEPTSGLDPVGRRMVRDIIREVRDKGATVFLNSHLLSEVEITCDRVAFIKHGEVLRTQPLQDFAAAGPDSQPALLEVLIRARSISSEAIEGLMRFGRVERQTDSSVLMKMESEAALPEIARCLVALGADVYEITPRRLSLEDLFLQIVGTDGGL